MKLKESTTFVNLARAFAGECQDGARYQFLKDKAEREGLAYVGQICTEHATNEMKHAKVFYDFITDNGTERVPNIEFTAGYPFKAGTLNEEIKSVAQDELNQATTIYPDFAQVAKDEGFHDVAQALQRWSAHTISYSNRFTPSSKRTSCTTAKKQFNGNARSAATRIRAEPPGRNVRCVTARREK